MKPKTSRNRSFGQNDPGYANAWGPDRALSSRSHYSSRPLATADPAPSQWGSASNKFILGRDGVLDLGAGLGLLQGKRVDQNGLNGNAPGPGLRFDRVTVPPPSFPQSGGRFEITGRRQPQNAGCELYSYGPHMFVIRPNFNPFVSKCCIGTTGVKRSSWEPQPRVRAINAHR